MELPLAVNPTGCARSEPKMSAHVKRFVLRYFCLTSPSPAQGFWWPSTHLSHLLLPTPTLSPSCLGCSERSSVVVLSLPLYAAACRPHTLNSTSASKSFQSTVTGELNAPYSKQFVHSKSSQYRKMKTEWKSNVYLARSRIQVGH